MTCTLCHQPIEESEESVKIPELWGGGITHEICFSAVVKTARRLISAVPFEPKEDN